MARRPSRRFNTLIVLAVLAGLLFLSRNVWLPLAGRSLIRDDGPAKADVAVVLAGDYYGRRVEKAAQLVRDGFVPRVIVSGPEGMFGMPESDLAIAFAVRKGYQADWFIPFPHDGLSTRAEAAAIVPELRRRNVRSFILVTSDYHTARAARIFRQAAKDGGPEMRVVAAPDRHFRADSWWKTRQGQKMVFMEWSKTLATAVGL
ncbi:MAG: YdcF family protein [Phycisphaerales bacterium]|nr:YdcF family protein [Phycisphaerales bacterium]